MIRQQQWAAGNEQFGVRGGVARRNLCAILQVLLPPEPQ